MMERQFLLSEEFSLVELDVLGCLFFFSSAKYNLLRAGWMGLNIGFVVWFWWVVKMILSHNGRTLLSDRYVVEIDEECGR